MAKISRGSTEIGKHRLADSVRYLCAFLVLLSPVLVAPTLAQEVEFEHLLQQIANTRHSVVVPLLTKDRKFGDIVITLQGDTLVSVKGQDFIALLPLTKQAEEILKNKVTETGTLTAADLNLLGFICEFDSSTLSLYVSIPLDRMSLQYLSYRSSLLDLSSVDQGNKHDYSFYSNFRYGQAYHEDDFSQSNARTTQLGSIDSAISVSGWVLELGANYYSAQVGDSGSPWRRDDIRISHDEKQRKMRFMGGDLVYPVTGFQRFNTMAGLGLSSNKHLDPYRVSQPTGHQSFQLEQAANVEILINNRLVRRLYLLRGNYNIQDLPGVTGINDVLVKVISTTGEVKEYSYSFVFNQQLLAEKDHDYSYNIGVFSRRLREGREYTNEAFFSGFHRYGFTEGITLGLNAQLTESHQLVGAQGQLTSELGALSFDYGLSYVDDWASALSDARLDSQGLPLSALPSKRSSSAYRLQYQYERYNFGAVSLSWQYNDPYFFNPNNEQRGGEVAANRGQWLANYSRALSGRLALAITRRGIDSRVDLASLRRWDVILTSRLGRYFRLGLQFSELQTTALGKTYEGVLTLSWQKYTSPNSYDYRYESHNRSSIVNYYNQTYLGEHNFQSSLSQRHNAVSDSRGSSVNIGYDQPRMVGSIGYEQVDSQSNELVVNRFDLGTSIVMANSHWSVSRPVSNSFIMVDTDVNLRNKEFVGVNPVRGGGFESKMTSRLPAVVTGVSPYYINSVFLDGTGTPLEYQSGADQLRIVTPYKTGRLALVRGDQTVSITGRLVNKSGVPIKFKVGDWVNAETGEALMFFTNETGVFSLQNLSYGSYSLQLYHTESTAVNLNVTDSMGKLANVGDLVVTED